MIKTCPILPSKLNLVVAIDKTGGISKNNKIPWLSIPEYKKDMLFFKKLTSNVCHGSCNAVIIGKNTYLDIGKPLPGRYNCVISKDPNIIDRTKYGHDIIERFTSVSDAINIIWSKDHIDNIFICGGKSIYDSVIDEELQIDNYYITKIKKDFDCDNKLSPTFMNHIDTLDKVETIYEDEYLDIGIYMNVLN